MQKGFRTFEKIPVSSFQHPETEKETKVVNQGMLQRQCNDRAADTKGRTVAPESKGQQQLSRRKTLLIPKPRPLLLPSYSNLQHKGSDRVVGLDKTKCIPLLGTLLFLREGTNGIKVSGCLLF